MSELTPPKVVAGRENTQLKIELVQVANDLYCVRKTKFRDFVGYKISDKITFAVLNRNGVNFEEDTLCDQTTMTEFNRTQEVYNALLLQEGLDDE